MEIPKIQIWPLCPRCGYKWTEGGRYCCACGEKGSDHIERFIEPYYAPLDRLPIRVNGCFKCKYYWMTYDMANISFCPMCGKSNIARSPLSWEVVKSECTASNSDGEDWKDGENWEEFEW